jgi:hypothetical protein
MTSESDFPPKLKPGETVPTLMLVDRIKRFEPSASRRTPRNCGGSSGLFRLILTTSRGARVIVFLHLHIYSGRLDRPCEHKHFDACLDFLSQKRLAIRSKIFQDILAVKLVNRINLDPAVFNRCRRGRLIDAPIVTILTGIPVTLAFKEVV